MYTPARRESSPIGTPSARKAVIGRMEDLLDPVPTTGCILYVMAIKKKETRGVGTRYRRGLVAAGGLISALTASSCGILALALSSVGVSGAWIGNFAQLVFVAATIAFLGTV